MIEVVIFCVIVYVLVAIWMYQDTLSDPKFRTRAALVGLTWPLWLTFMLVALAVQKMKKLTGKYRGTKGV